MTPEELKGLQEKAALWDSLSPTLKQIFVSQIGYMPSVRMECEITKEGYLRATETIQNTSNASSHVDLLEEEYSVYLCSCNLKKCECLTQNNN